MIKIHATSNQLEDAVTGFHMTEDMVNADDKHNFGLGYDGARANSKGLKDNKSSAARSKTGKSTKGGRSAAPTKAYKTNLSDDSDDDADSDNESDEGSDDSDKASGDEENESNRGGSKVSILNTPPYGEMLACVS